MCLLAESAKVVQETKEERNQQQQLCCGGARTYHTPLGNVEERRECLKRVALEEMKSRVRKLPHPNPEVDEYKGGILC